MYGCLNQNIQYKDIKKVYCGHRKPWSSITSLYWMVMRKQFPLLEDKLQSDRYLHINPLGIQIFFERCFNRNIILKMLEKKFSELSISDLIMTSIRKRNSVALEILLEKRIKGNGFVNNNNDNSKYFLPIYPSTFITTVKFSNHEILEMLLNHLDQDERNTLITPIKSDLIKNSLLNFSFKEDMLLFLLNNPIISPFIENSNKNNDSNKISLPFSQFMSFKSIKLKNQLLELNFVEIPTIEMINVKDAARLSIEELELILRIKCYMDREEIKCHSETMGDNREEIKKALLTKIIRKFKSDELYLEFLCLYNSVIEDLRTEVVMAYTFNYFDVNSLNFIIKSFSGTDTEKKVEYSRFVFEKFLESTKLTNDQKENQIKEFLQLYLGSSIKNQVVFEGWNKIIEILLGRFEISVQTLEFINSSNVIPASEYFNFKNPQVVPFSKYKWYIELALKSNLTLDQINQINQVPSLTQNESIDFVIENYEFYQLDTKEINLSNLFKSLDNVSYFRNKLESNEIYSKLKENLLKPSIYIKAFFRALSTSDIPSLIFFESIITNTPHSSQVTATSPSLYINSYQSGSICSKEQIGTLLEYLNERGFKYLFTESIFFDFINDLFLQFDDSEIKQLKINFNQFPEQSIKLLFRHLQRFRLPLIKFIVSQMDFDRLFATDDKDGSSCPIKELLESTLHEIELPIGSDNTGIMNFKNLFSIIYYLLLNIPKKHHHYFESTFLYLYKSIITTSDITLEEIKEINQLYEEYQIIIKPTLFHLVHYLKAKDQILGYYLLRISNFYTYCSNPNSITSKQTEEMNSEATNELNLDLISKTSVKDLFILLKSRIVDKYIYGQESAKVFLMLSQFDLFLETISLAKESVEIPPLESIEQSLSQVLDKESLKKLLNQNTIFTKEPENKNQLLLIFFKYQRLDLVEYLLLDESNGPQERELYISSISSQILTDLIKDYNFDTIKLLSSYSPQIFKQMTEVEFELCFSVGHVEMYDFLARNYQAPDYKINNKSILAATSNNEPFIILNNLKRITNKKAVTDSFKTHKDFKYLKF
ncbi:hypothetical protein DICPUDRAFT_98535 [Dictyostelium purpureum]|uniref:Uncharacterized protein n=1 Tax=Dictyostelium purpureum TaxID=5786 RepID=F0ZRA1_DICPU|nr:uncharacterized protein DICPUDRAFT_98535 [Dictyostelium purpureum]EGC33524.1 hypothetical protein DICPUDRAFT_98535 [Dictyostelium purpureum]|eukprot:XP_003289949.1 hypothetical protein DICPUDRAFT_98535 [Dictyostelium purpureum]